MIVYSGLATCGSFLIVVFWVGAAIRPVGVYELKLIVSDVRDASLREPAAATAAGWSEEAVEELFPAEFNAFTSSAAAERSLIVALPAALAAYCMDLLTKRWKQLMNWLD